RERAIDLSRALLAEFPDDPAAWGQIGYNYLRLSRYADAATALRKQIQLDSTDANAVLNLATALMGEHQYDEAIRTYRRAFALRPGFLTVNNINSEFGKALVNNRRLDDARGAFEAMLRGSADQQAQGQRSLGLLSMLQGRYGDAIERFR